MPTLSNFYYRQYELLNARKRSPYELYRGLKGYIGFDIEFRVYIPYTGLQRDYIGVYCRGYKGAY